MGFANWFLKNGHGSPSSTAKVFIKQYHKMSSGNHDKEWEGIFYSLFMQRYLVNQKLGFRGGSLFGQVDANEIIENTEGDLALFVFSIMRIETSYFRNNIDDTFNEVTGVIYEVRSTYNVKI